MLNAVSIEKYVANNAAADDTNKLFIIPLTTGTSLFAKTLFKLVLKKLPIVNENPF